MMNAGSYQAWWLAAMMNGGFGMFSFPTTVMRNRWVMIHATSRRRKRYVRGGSSGEAWTSGSLGPLTRTRYSGLR